MYASIVKGTTFENITSIFLSKSMNDLGLDAMRLITDYLLVNSTGNMSAEARVLSTAMLHQLGLDKDVLRLIPWLGVAQSDLGDLPKTTLGLILEEHQGLVVSITEMLYEGLVAIGNFLESIASVISAWGQAAWKTERCCECNKGCCGECRAGSERDLGLDV